MNYELFYLVGASKEADLPKVKSEISEIITAEGGVFSEKQVTERRKLAYKVKHETYGFYVAQRFELEDTEKLNSINKKLNLYTGILRFLISKTDDLPELTTREERKEKESAKARIEPKKPIEKAPAELPREKEEALKAPAETEITENKKTEKEKVSQEDIDKKLEEILNI